MVRKLFVLVFLVFGISVLSISLWRMNVVSVTMAIDSSPSSEIEKSIQQSDNKEIVAADYPLPYPGLLPDHPLYFLKMIRDRIQLWLTRNPLSRAQMLLHYADKRMAAALVLAENGKSGLAVSTTMKASQYLERSVLQIDSFPDDREVEGMSLALTRALVKHEQVFRGIESRIPDEAKGGLNDVRTLYERVEDQIMDEQEIENENEGGREKSEGEVEEKEEKDTEEQEDDEETQMESEGVGKDTNENEE